MTGTAEGMTRAREAEAAPTGRTRDRHLDSAKLVLVVLVVLGHNWFFALGSSHVVKAAYMLVYAFHMPAFALLCGYFSRRFEGRPDQLRKLAITLLVPYLVFEVLYTFVTAVSSHKPFVLHLSSPVYVCWFLLALFVWRLTSPLWRAVRNPVLIAVALSLLAGITVTSTDFALSRTLQLLPWFVIGMWLRPDHFERLRSRGARALAALTMALGGVAAYLLAPGFDVRWLDREWSSHALGVSPQRFLATAGLLDIATLLLVAAALALIPALPSWLAALGAFTMYPFLLHGLIVRVLQRSGVHQHLIGQGALGLILITVGAVALALLLSTPPVRRATAWIVEPPLRLRSAAA